jgi:hypothetical protein
LFSDVQVFKILTKADDAGALLGIMKFMGDGKPVDIASWDD